MDPYIGNAPCALATAWSTRTAHLRLRRSVVYILGRILDVDRLRAFVAVARARRFTRAARALGVSQPSLSRRVQQLEEDLGAKLVVRTPGGVVLTSSGERFLPHAERALASVDAGRNAIEELSEQPRGAITLGSQPTLSAYILPAVLARFHALHPSIVLRLREGTTENVEELLAAGEVELALMNLPVRRLDLAVQRLWQEDYMLVVPVDHRLAAVGRAIALVEVAGEPLVVIAGIPPTDALFAACEQRGVHPRVVVEADNLEAVRRMVERGLGVTLLPRMMAEAADPRQLRALEIARGGLSRQIALVHRGEAYLTAAARALRELIVTMLRRKKAPEAGKGR
jgi:LysR family transcriptional activator of glutamate synthase operon